MSEKTPRRPGRQPALPQPYRRPQLLNCPEPGFFKLRMVRGGVWVPALIWQPCPMVIPEDPNEEAVGEMPSDWCYPIDPYRGPRALLARIGDAAVDPLEVWQRGRKITGEEYYWRRGLREWAIVKAPSQPEANPRQPVDLRRQPSMF